MKRSMRCLALFAVLLLTAACTQSNGDTQDGRTFFRALASGTGSSAFSPDDLTTLTRGSSTVVRVRFADVTEGRALPSSDAAGAAFTPSTVWVMCEVLERVRGPQPQLNNGYLKLELVKPYLATVEDLKASLPKDPLILYLSSTREQLKRVNAPTAMQLTEPEGIFLLRTPRALIQQGNGYLIAPMSDDADTLIGTFQAETLDDLVKRTREIPA